MDRPLTVVVLVGLVVVAGCAGGADRTPEPIRGEATPATVSQSGLSSSGYEQVTVDSQRVNRTGTIDVSGDVEMTVNYQVRATAQQAVYRKSDAELPSVFALFSVPLVSPDSVDVSIDPMGDRPLSEVAARSQETYADFGDLEHVTNASVTLLGTETTLQKYATTADADGNTVDVYVYVAVVEHDGDVVRAVAVLPQEADDAEMVRTLLASAQH